MISDRRPSFAPPRDPSFPVGPATTPRPTVLTTTPVASVPVPTAPSRKRRRPSTVGIVITSVLVLGALVFAAVVAVSLLSAPDYDRGVADQPGSPIGDTRVADPLEPGSSCDDELMADVRAAATEIGLSFEGADCLGPGEVVVSLDRRYSRARLVSVAQQLLATLYNDGWDLERVEVYDVAGTGAYDSW